MRALNITEERLRIRACRQAARDHVDSPRSMFGGRFTITPLPAERCTVKSIEFFDRVYTGTPDHIGMIEIAYAREGCAALYGFTADGDLIMYAN
jgi:hypothetical protein